MGSRCSCLSNKKAATSTSVQQPGLEIILKINSKDIVQQNLSLQNQYTIQEITKLPKFLDKCTIKWENSINNNSSLVDAQINQRGSFTPSSSRSSLMSIAEKVHGYIYLVHAIGTPRYKIGKTRREPSKRFLELNSSQSPYPLRLLSFYETDDIDLQEKRLHHAAGDYRVHGEWFELPEWWIVRLDTWFSNQKHSGPLIRTWKDDLIIVAKNNQEKSDAGYQDVYKKAIDAILTLNNKQYSSLINYLKLYIETEDQTAKNKAQKILGFRFPSKLYAITFKKTLKLARSNLKKSLTSHSHTSFLENANKGVCDE